MGFMKAMKVQVDCTQVAERPDQIARQLEPIQLLNKQDHGLWVP